MGKHSSGLLLSKLLVGSQRVKVEAGQMTSALPLKGKLHHSYITSNLAWSIFVTLHVIGVVA